MTTLPYTTDGRDRAVIEWRAALGFDAISTEVDNLLHYARDTIDFATAAVAVIWPRNTAQVQEVVRIASRFCIPLHPISTGRNWGYGTANAPQDGCAIVDMSRMNKVISVDPALGLATLEPGTTQIDLRSYLDERRLPFMVPTTGAGPSCSLIGNALERGYGITPIVDHFSAVISLEAVLADGSLYRSPMSYVAAEPVLKWGLGPYLDGLFSQANLGIVTRMTIALKRLPERVEAFYFRVDSDKGIERTVEAVRNLLQMSGENIGGINIMNDVRVVAMTAPYPDNYWESDRRKSAAPNEPTADSIGAAPWTGVGAIYGTKRHVAVTRSLVRKTLAHVSSRITFLNRDKVRRGISILRKLPWKPARRLLRTLSMMSHSLAIMEGIPDEIALPLAYWKSTAAPISPIDPARDGCGLLWYAPIVPMRAADVRRFVDLTRSVCADHEFEGPITLTSISDRGFGTTVPLLFDRNDPEACRCADSCWRALFEAGRRAGFMPSRCHPRYMSLMTEATLPFWEPARRIKEALDPQGLLSPGRYIPSTPLATDVERCASVNHKDV